MEMRSFGLPASRPGSLLRLRNRHLHDLTLIPGPALSGVEQKPRPPRCRRPAGVWNLPLCLSLSFLVPVRTMTVSFYVSDVGVVRFDVAHNDGNFQRHAGPVGWYRSVVGVHLLTRTGLGLSFSSTVSQYRCLCLPPNSIRAVPSCDGPSRMVGRWETHHAPVWGAMRSVSITAGAGVWVPDAIGCRVVMVGGC